jgi:15-cis-phytoene synthase
MDRRQLEVGFKEAKQITKKFAKSFYLASIFLPKDKRYASYTVYAICRLSDETVDDSTCPDPEHNLKILEQKISAAYTKNIIDTPLLAAFRHTVNTYQIPKEYFDILIKGMRMDLELKRYPNFPALYEYCYRVAGVIGQIMIKILGCQDKAAETYAIELGVAMQLTNILRDIQEDLQRNRIYLPLDEMFTFGISENQLAQNEINPAFKDLMRFQIRRNREFYRQSLPGIKLINNLRGRLLVLTMQEIYSRILNAIEKNNYDIFTKRCYVRRSEKIMVLLKIFREGKYL